MKHMFHPMHTLTLRYHRYGKCEACLRHSSGCIYECSQCQWYMDVRWALSKPKTMMSKIHPHPLALFNKPNYDIYALLVAISALPLSSVVCCATSISMSIVFQYCHLHSSTSIMSIPSLSTVLQLKTILMKMMMQSFTVTLAKKEECWPTQLITVKIATMLLIVIAPYLRSQLSLSLSGCSLSVRPHFMSAILTATRALPFSSSAIVTATTARRSKGNTPSLYPVAIWEMLYTRVRDSPIYINESDKLVQRISSAKKVIYMLYSPKHTYTLCSSTNNDEG
ncbi:uncharacterized protein LOC114262371 [Camellia sinensis]|uniref:uncharacterized protein LOC114262371 n=1 Tax=Camellia sinensis TaxID=4442 RepID=UPI001035DE5A|nr:uncharacterized protein LOC114262371 [Camellia sinensis]